MKPIIIIGGGLAGLTAGIGLRQEGVPVTVLEAGRYPRHRVCGEFISGNGQRVLELMGLEKLLVQRGAIPAKTAAFYLGNRATQQMPLPFPALCVTRLVLDAALAGEFRRLGGRLEESTRWTGPMGDEGTVIATGRRKSVKKMGWLWYGLKVHARNVPLEGDLEMHLVEDGYVGLCRLPRAEVNVCGLFRRRLGQNQPPLQSMAGPFERLKGHPGSRLWKLLEGADFDEHSFCSVGGLSFRLEWAAERMEFCLGDAITMIPPITGNGMSMAFESAHLAVQALAGYSKGAISWAAAKSRYSDTCDAAFARRLRWGGRLQRAALCTGTRAVLIALGRAAIIRNLLFRLTR